MNIYNILLYFVVGGITVASAVLLAESGNPILSGLAISFPGVTVASFYFMGKSAGLEITSKSINSAIVSVVIAWLPYMFTLSYFAPRVGVNKAILISIVVFLVIGSVWVYLNNKYTFI